MKLIELLVVITIIAILTSIGVPVVVRTGKEIKRKWYEINVWHGARLDATLKDDIHQKDLDYYMTNGTNPQVYHWNIVKPPS